MRVGDRPETFTDCVMMDKFPRLGFIICTVPTGFNQIKFMTCTDIPLGCEEKLLELLFAFIFIIFFLNFYFVYVFNARGSIIVH